jgi:Ca2+-binding RTX toxin-like protein
VTTATVTVDFATADGTATAGADYTALNGTLTFDPGVTEQEIRVPVQGDDVLEPDEMFFVNLSNPVNDVIVDGQGEATIVNDDDASPGSDDDVLTGGDGDDVLIGGSGDDEIKGAGGDDTLVGGSDDDSVSGGDGDDNLAGGSGDDVLRGGSGDDVLRGGSGNDTLYSGAGNDELTGGSGEDVFDFGSLSASNGAKEQDLIRDYTPGEDVITLPGRAPTDADVLDIGLNSITIALPDSPDGDTLEILGVNSLDDVTFITR